MPSSNVQVRTIQNLLRLRGFSPPVNGKLDDITKDYYDKFCEKGKPPQQKKFLDKKKAINDLAFVLKLEVGLNKNKAISECIKEIQSKLQEKGCIVSSDGVFGQQTEKALKQFQNEMGIPPTGEIKPYLYTDDTWVKLMKDNSNQRLNEPNKSAVEIIKKEMPCVRVVVAPFSASAPGHRKDTVDRETKIILKRGSQGEKVKTLQDSLMKAGYHIDAGFNDNNFGIDGVFGENTETVLNYYLVNIGRELLPSTYIDDYKIQCPGSEWKELQHQAREESAIKGDKATLDVIIKKLKNKGYGHMYDELIKNWDEIVDKGSKYQYKKVGGEVVEIKVNEEQVEWANNVKRRTPKTEDKLKYFFWEKVAYICYRILAPSGRVFDRDDTSPYFFSFNDNNKYLLKLNNNKLKRLPDWVNIGDKIKGCNNFKIKEEALSWGTSWSVETLKRINEALENPIDFVKGLEKLSKEEITKKTGNIEKYQVTITDFSPKQGYRLSGVTHKTGLDIDFRVITDNGNRGYLAGYRHQNGKIAESNSTNYDQEGQRVFLELLKVLNKSRKITFRGGTIPALNDGKLKEEGLCRKVPLHYDHVHLEIGEPPILATK